jgi:predicted Zn finger-like uncharacterized protein
MIFSCSKCKTKYKIPDEKVAGKVLKIRCKSCGAIVVVRDPTLATEKEIERQVGPPSAPPAPVEAPIWYVAIDGRQQGPFTYAVVRDQAAGGQIGADSFVWKAGMSDWLRADEVPELVGLLPKAPEVPVPPVPEPAADPAAAHVEPEPERQPEADQKLGLEADGAVAPAQAAAETAEKSATEPDLAAASSPRIGATDPLSRTSNLRPATTEIDLRDALVTFDPAAARAEAAEAVARKAQEVDQAAVPADLSEDLFAGEEALAEKAAPKQALKDAAAALDELDILNRPVKLEKKVLREEFSMLVRLDKGSKRRKLVWIAAGLLIATGIAVPSVFAYLEHAEDERALAEFLANAGVDENGNPTYGGRVLSYDGMVLEREKALGRKLSTREREALQDIVMEAEQLQAKAEPEKKAPPKKTSSYLGKPSSPSADKTMMLAHADEAKKEAEAALAHKNLTPAEWALLHGDEHKLDLKNDAAKEAEAEAAKKAEANASERNQKVAKAFGEKTRQFSKCKEGDGEGDSEKVKVTFTITALGRVTSVKLTGTDSAAKKGCIENVLQTAIFPAGDGEQTYLQTLVI